MLKIEYVDIDTIRPYENNAKEHPIEQIEQIKKSIQEFGNNDPIAVWNNEIVEGHGRYEALKQLGEKSIPIIRLDNLTDQQRKAYTLVHNKLTMNSDFDFELLSQELDNILDINMEDFGFDNFQAEAYIDDLLENEYAGQEVTSNLFAITFCFNKSKEKEIKKFIAENGKEKIVEYIEDLILAEEDNNA